MTRNLIHHMLKKRHSGIKINLTFTIQIDTGSNLGFKGVSAYARTAIGHDQCSLGQKTYYRGFYGFSKAR
jgi:hypothetical protein